MLLTSANFKGPSWSVNLQSKYFLKINQQIEFHRSMIVIQILGIPWKNLIYGMRLKSDWYSESIYLLQREWILWWLWLVIQPGFLVMFTMRILPAKIELSLFSGSETCQILPFTRKFCAQHMWDLVQTKYFTHFNSVFLTN